ncbi:hypothetical protein [Faecalicoccus pleomorphus]|uniref:hypothetical protein n=1 Tax=Faecalicoccus pleomorphus TaxID=1323 RepID=UPI00232FB1DC|nr:hypothetical protein [Faecalicoccus pleomorphus]MDB7986550.1 hypothetical protein [Faecalicoccus pleomorphus]MDB7990709.1 hypothetical protein [Faecalicoccus pleomorphus]
MKRKQIMSLLLGAMLLFGCSSPSLESIRLSVEDAKEIEVGDTVEVEVETDPSDFELDKESFRVTKKADLSLKDNTLLVVPQTAGEYQVTASQDDVTSNTLRFTVKEKENKKEDTKEDAKKDMEEKTESSQQDPIKDAQGSNNTPETSSDSNSSSSDNAVSWSQSDPLSVDETLQYGDLLQKSGQSVWLQGDLPQTMTNGGMILYNADHSTFISIEDPMHLIDFGGTNAMIVGKIKQQGSSYCVVVEKAYAL